MIKKYKFSNGKELNVNCSSIIGVHFQNEYNKNIFKCFKEMLATFQKLDNNKDLKDTEIFDLIDGELLNDCMNITYLMVRYGNNGISTKEEFFNLFNYMEITMDSLNVASMLVETTNKEKIPKVGYKKNKKKKKRGK